MCFTGYNAKDGPDARWKTAEERKAENEKTESYIVSRYVQDPLLIGGKKFDLRVYVVVTSYRPLRAYVSRLGFARFCSVSYSEAKADMDNPFVHLTNGTFVCVCHLLFPSMFPCVCPHQSRQSTHQSFI